MTLDGCARLVPSGAVENLAAAIRELLEHPSEARALGEKARKRCLEEYSMRRVADALLGVVKRVI